ncbi:uncharacterized protein LOC128195030 isoform X1 [Vigna angularis]|uniref:uncharacterized protein LOC108323536 isoform X2 n=1 Tax=Phaseolus angularis TaxID=3914 RepID=UPI0022B3C7CE|nr:uncharacterized protein LOC108323536 isoform X2 [Vigna angularis]XP_052727898.1 uncharacterized protein LOC128195030 isoform X1 [Vigna angularis]
MKHLMFKRQNELKEFYRGVHMDFDSEFARQILTSLIECGSCTEHGMDLSGSPSSVLSLFLGSPSSLFVKEKSMVERMISVPQQKFSNLASHFCNNGRHCHKAFTIKCIIIKTFLYTW